MKIFYGVCGEGMGHAGRSIAMIERLTALGHRVTIFTYAEAYRLLVDAGYEPQRIQGLHFHQKTDGAVDVWRTAGGFCQFLRRRRESVDFIRQMALEQQPDLFLTDFEPLTALAAASLRKECVSIDNQHRFCHPLGSDFPRHLQVYGRLAGAFVHRWIKRPRQCIVAVFHRCPASRHYRHVDALLRGRISRIEPTPGDHVLLYARAGLGRRMAEVAAGVSACFVAYGCEGPPAANIEYKRTSDEHFARDLASCRAVICSGGQQLIGEARYFGKPLLIVPIPKQHEQEINAHYASREGIGSYCPVAELNGRRVDEFLRGQYGRRRGVNGVDQVFDLLGINNG
ncbi:MAG: glycosyltransferase family protein [Pirellulales bacterium]